MNQNLNRSLSLSEELIALGYDPISVGFVIEITQKKSEAIEYLGGESGRKLHANAPVVGSGNNNNNNHNCVSVVVSYCCCFYLIMRVVFKYF